MSGQLDRWADTASAQSFDRRYSGGSVEFWVPRLVELGRIRRGQWILDAGCGTGGFAAAIAGATGANVLGCDLAERFIQRAAAEHGRSRWALADVARLPVRSQSIDRVLMSLLLHRVPDPAAVIAEAARVLRPGGLLLVKTVAPADAAAAVPYRFFPAMAAAQRRRMPGTEELLAWIRQAALGHPRVERILREHQMRRPDEIEQGCPVSRPQALPGAGSGAAADRAGPPPRGIPARWCRTAPEHRHRGGQVGLSLVNRSPTSHSVT